jgi:hypothetical protein
MPHGHPWQPRKALGQKAGHDAGIIDQVVVVPAGTQTRQRRTAAMATLV